MDVASPPTARIAGRTSLDAEAATIFTATRKFHTLATRVTNGWHPDVGYRGSQHPSATGHGHRTP